MKKLILFLLLLSTPVFAQTIIDGQGRTKADILEFKGISTPSVSSTNKARIYLNVTTGKLMCSEDGAAYVECIGGGTAGSIAASGINWTDWQNLSPTTINWLDYEGLAGSVINWTDLEATTSPTSLNWIDTTLITGEVQTPAGESSTQSLLVGTAPNQLQIDANGQIKKYAGTGTAGLNWTDWDKIQTANINWSDVKGSELWEEGINWADMTGGLMPSGGINWIDVQNLAGTGRGGTVYAKNIHATINSPTVDAPNVIWQNVTGMTYNLTKVMASSTSATSAALFRAGYNTNGGINWADITEMEPLDMNELSDPAGLYASGTINWSDIKQAQVGTINWATLQDDEYMGINWGSISPTETKITVEGYLTGAGK